MNRLPEISAFFPAYNEARNLKQMVDSLRAVLAEVSHRYEIIIVNDGSVDGTAAQADTLAKQYPEVRVVHHTSNRGYGAAVRSGIRACRYEYIFFTDGDCQFDVREIKKFIPFVGLYDIVAGFRSKRADPFFRWLYSRGWNLLIRYMLGVKIKDLNCAFKIFKAKPLQAMSLKTTGAMINAEIMAYARRQGLTLYEIPVQHLPRTAGKQTGANPQVILRAFKELVQIFLNRQHLGTL